MVKRTLSNKLFCFPKVQNADFPSTTDKSTTLAVCDDTSTRCNEFKKYCDKNSYVTKRCQKTCGKCSKSSC